MRDLIDRELALIVLEKNGYTKNMKIHRALLNLPTVEAAPVVHSKWLFLENGVYQCSVCGRETDMEQNKYEVYRYCPNCAAKMDL